MSIGPAFRFFPVCPASAAFAPRAERFCRTLRFSRFRRSCWVRAKDGRMRANGPQIPSRNGWNSRVPAILDVKDLKPEQPCRFWLGLGFRRVSVVVACPVVLCLFVVLYCVSSVSSCSSDCGFDLTQTGNTICIGCIPQTLLWNICLDLIGPPFRPRLKPHTEANSRLNPHTPRLRSLGEPRTSAGRCFSSPPREAYDVLAPRDVFFGEARKGPPGLHRFHRARSVFLAMTGNGWELMIGQTTGRL